MWYWLLMGGLLLPMLLFIKGNRPKWLTAFKLLFFISLTGCLVLQHSDTSLSWACSLIALIFFTLCYGLEELTPQYRTIQLSFFSMACLSYSLTFWLQVDSLSWAVSIASFALIVITFFLLLPLLDSFILPASLVALILWQLLWASGELWHMNRNVLDMSALLGTLLLSITVVMWAIENFKKPFSQSYGWITGCYFSAHILIIAPLVMK